MNKREGRTESTWTILRQETRTWASTMKYWVDQLSAFESLLEHSVLKELSADQEDRVSHFKETLRLYGEDVLPDMKNRLYDHLKLLDAKKEKPFSPRSEIVRNHDSFRTQIDKLVRALEVQLSEFRAIHEEVGIVTESHSMNINCVLIPTDFSTNAQHATDYALMLFCHDVERIILLHVCTTPYVMTEATSMLVISANEDDNALFEKEKDRLRLAFPSNTCKIESLSLTGFLTEKIDEAAKNNKADLIVMGPGEDSGFMKLIAGSNTLSVMDGISVPTLIVPAEAPLLPPDHMMLALDLKLKTRPVHFDILMSIRNHFRSRLEVVHVDMESTEPTTSQDLQMENNLLDTLGFTDKSIEHISGEGIKETLNALVSDRSIDLLCVIGHPHSWIHIAVGKSVSHQMVIDTHVPVLVLHQ